MNCQICNKETNGRKGLSIHLKKKHGYDSSLLKDYYDKFLKNIDEGKCYFCDNDAIFKNLTDGYHRICNSKECLGKTRATGTYKFLMYKYNLSKEDAIKEMENRSIERGKKIKNGLYEKYKENKNFFKEKSHQTVEYWIKKGYTEKESEEKVKEVMNMVHEKTWTKRRNNPESYKDVNTTQLDYWLKKGYNEEESKEKIKERQCTFTLEKCIQKYGEEIGTNIFNERQRKWSEKIEKKYKNGDFSKLSHNMFSLPEYELMNTLTEKLDIDAYYGDNQFFRHFTDLKRTYSYDFRYKNKIIEYNGDYWHCNPKFYNSNYFHKHLNMYAKDIWNNDKNKIDRIKKDGYVVLVVWENEYKKNKDKVIEKCIKFLNDE